MLGSEFHCKEDDGTTILQHIPLTWFRLLWRKTRLLWFVRLLALNTTSLKCCLLSTGAIDRREKIHACIWRFKVASCKRGSLKSIRFSQKKIRLDTLLTDPIFIVPSVTDIPLLKATLDQSYEMFHIKLTVCVTFNWSCGFKSLLPRTSTWLENVAYEIRNFRELTLKRKFSGSHGRTVVPMDLNEFMTTVFNS